MFVVCTHKYNSTLTRKVLRCYCVLTGRHMYTSSNNVALLVGFCYVIVLYVQERCSHPRMHLRVLNTIMCVIQTNIVSNIA
jgi:hypothetical protein